ncbi:MAG: SseB family protein [Clostridiales bacterium]|nr:SseB family protein [Clostridiales bacterium]
MKSMNEELNDFFIKKQLRKYLKTDEPEDMLMLLANFALRINDDGTAPSPVKTELKIVLGFDPDMETEDVFADDDEPAKTSCLIVEEDGSKWLPLFTGYDELGSMGRDNFVEDRTILDIVTDAFEDGEISGLVINPYSEAMALRKELLYVILHLLDDEDMEAG